MLSMSFFDMDCVCETESPGSREASGSRCSPLSGNSASEAYCLDDEASMSIGCGPVYRMLVERPIVDFVAHVSPGWTVMGLYLGPVS